MIVILPAGNDCLYSPGYQFPFSSSSRNAPSLLVILFQIFTSFLLLLDSYFLTKVVCTYYRLFSCFVLLEFGTWYSKYSSQVGGKNKATFNPDGCRNSQLQRGFTCPIALIHRTAHCRQQFFVPISQMWNPKIEEVKGLVRMHSELIPGIYMLPSSSPSFMSTNLVLFLLSGFGFCSFLFPFYLFVLLLIETVLIVISLFKELLFWWLFFFFLLDFVV